MVPCGPGEIQTCGSEQCLALTSNDNLNLGNNTQAGQVQVGSRSSEFLVLL